MSLHACRVDAFTTTPGQGNAAGVVTDATWLKPAQMQAIAAELRCSETAFVLPASGPGNDLRLRFFTPTVEVPVCGHATVAAHCVLASRSGHAGVQHQLTGAGVQRIETVRDDAGIAVRIRQNRPEFREPLAPELVAEVTAALGLDIGDLDRRCPVQFVSTGHGKLLLGIERRDRLRGLQPHFRQLARLSPRVGSNGYYVFTLDRAEDDDALCHGRMFAPAIGIPEDPVTGNANGPLGAYLVRHGLLPTVGGRVRFRARQQAANGRGGFIDVSVRAEADIPVEVEIEGRAVIGPQVALASIGQA